MFSTCRVFIIMRQKLHHRFLKCQILIACLPFLFNGERDVFDFDLYPRLLRDPGKWIFGNILASVLTQIISLTLIYRTILICRLHFPNYCITLRRARAVSRWEFSTTAVRVSVNKCAFVKTLRKNLVILASMNCSSFSDHWNS